MELSKALNCFVAAQGRWAEAAEAAKAQGLLRKTAVGGSTAADISGDFQSATGAAFLTYLQEGPSAFDRIRPYTRPAAFRTPLITPAAPLSAAVIAEAQPAPVTKLSNNSSALTPTKAGGLAVASKEALSTPEGVEAFTLELRTAVGIATDEEFLSTLADDAGTTEAATADALADLKKLLDGVNNSGFGGLFFVSSPDAANVLATLRAGTDGPLLFPSVTPTGGELLGVPLLVTAGAGDSLYLVDAGAVATGAEDIQIKMSDQASVFMDDMDSDGPQTPVSVFQADAVALLGIRSFAAKLTRTSGAAVLTGPAAAWA